MQAPIVMVSIGGDQHPILLLDRRPRSSAVQRQAKSYKQQWLNPSLRHSQSFAVRASDYPRSDCAVQVEVIS
jgi:hypothetical protein